MLETTLYVKNELNAILNFIWTGVRFPVSRSPKWTKDTELSKYTRTNANSLNFYGFHEKVF